MKVHLIYRKGEYFPKKMDCVHTNYISKCPHCGVRTFENYYTLGSIKVISKSEDNGRKGKRNFEWMLN